MPETHFLGKVATKAIIVKDGKILMTRDHKDTALWDLPGGRINIEENIDAGLEREIMEELGVHIRVKGIVFSEQIIHRRDGTPHLFITCEVTMVDPSASFKIPSEEVAEIQWVSKDMLADLKTYDSCRTALETYWAKR